MMKPVPIHYKSAQRSAFPDCFPSLDRSSARGLRTPQKAPYTLYRLLCGLDEGIANEGGKGDITLGTGYISRGYDDRNIRPVGHQHIGWSSAFARKQAGKTVAQSLCRRFYGHGASTGKHCRFLFLRKLLPTGFMSHAPGLVIKNSAKRRSGRTVRRV